MAEVAAADELAGESFLRGIMGLGINGLQLNRVVQSAGPVSEALSFSRIVHCLGLTFTFLGSLLEALLQSWDHFWETFGTCSREGGLP